MSLAVLWHSAAVVVATGGTADPASLRLSLAEALVPAAFAWQETSTPETVDDLEFHFSLYAWVPALKGTVSIGSISVPLDGDLGDTLSDLKGVIFGHIEVQPGPWIFYIDAMYADLGTDVGLPLGGNVDVDFKQTTIALGMGYQIGKWPLGDGEHTTLAIDVIGGLQWTNLDMTVSITGLLSAQGKASTDWVDPFIGGRLALSFAENWSFGVRGDVGGFGIGSASQLMWEFDVGFNWSVNDWFSFLFGYRVLDFDYVRGSGSDRFEYDMSLHGPFVAFQFKF